MSLPASQETGPQQRAGRVLWPSLPWWEQPEEMLSLFSVIFMEFLKLNLCLCLSERRFPQLLRIWENTRAKTRRGKSPCRRVSGAPGPCLWDGGRQSCALCGCSGAAGGSLPGRFAPPRHCPRDRRCPCPAGCPGRNHGDVAVTLLSTSDGRRADGPPRSAVCCFPTGKMKCSCLLPATCPVAEPPGARGPRPCRGVQLPGAQ